MLLYSLNAGCFLILLWLTPLPLSLSLSLLPVSPCRPSRSLVSIPGVPPPISDFSHLSRGRRGSARVPLLDTSTGGILHVSPVSSFSPPHPLPTRCDLPEASKKIGGPSATPAPTVKQERAPQPGPLLLSPHALSLTSLPPPPSPFPFPLNLPSTNRLKRELTLRLPPLLFLSPFCPSPLPSPMGGYDSTSCAPCDTTNTSRYHARPGVQIAPSTVKYHCFSASASSSPSSRSSLLSLEKICRLSPKPKGHERFSSVEVVHAGGPLAEQLLSVPRIDGACPVRVYELPETHLDPTQEFKAIFELEEAMMLQRANRQSLIVWIGRPDRPELDGFAGFLGMLPFRGVNVALVSADESAYPDPFRYRTPSGVIEHDATDPARMGKCCIVAMFGPLASRTFTSELAEWTPIDIQPASHEPMKRLPFKIAGLPLPMITYTGDYDSGVEELASRISAAYTADSLFPIVSCGQVVDGIGYGLDVLQALERRGHRGYYFTHRSGETNKRWAEYGQPELLERVSSAKAAGQTVLFLAVGGGCNGNATGVVAAMTNSHFIEVPTTPLHYNDATTSAKKAFSLVRDGKILSKNLLGTFFLPRLVFCINEVMLTSNSASIHSTVGECTKTMNMVAMADSAAGQLDYHNILGAHEFASDTTKILSCIDGFEQLISFIHDSGVRAAKHAVLDVGAQIASLRAQPCSSANDKRMAELVALRRELLRTFRQRFYSLPDASRKAIDEFLTVSNLEIVGAKVAWLPSPSPCALFVVATRAHTAQPLPPLYALRPCSWRMKIPSRSIARCSSSTRTPSATLSRRG